MLVFFYIFDRKEREFIRLENRIIFFILKIQKSSFSIDRKKGE